MKVERFEASIKVGSLQESSQGAIVLVTEIIDEDTFAGVVIYPTANYRIGFYSKDWNEPYFSPFLGELKLTNV